MVRDNYAFPPSAQREILSPLGLRPRCMLDGMHLKFWSARIGVVPSGRQGVASLRLAVAKRKMLSPPGRTRCRDLVGTYRSCFLETIRSCLPTQASAEMLNQPGCTPRCMLACSQNLIGLGLGVVVEGGREGGREGDLCGRRLGERVEVDGEENECTVAMNW